MNDPMLPTPTDAITGLEPMLAPSANDLNCGEMVIGPIRGPGVMEFIFGRMMASVTCGDEKANVAMKSAVMDAGPGSTITMPVRVGLSDGSAVAFAVFVDEAFECVVPGRRVRWTVSGWVQGERSE